MQAQERDDLDAFLDQAAAICRASLNFDKLPHLHALPTSPPTRILPPAQRIAVAQDQAFAFTYPHLLRDWQQSGATIETFSPLADDRTPVADLIYLPGGYPELYAGRLAQNVNFMTSLRVAAQTTAIYGECGGYMVLGDTLTDKDGQDHAMAGLLNLHTSFEKRKLRLGYRNITAKRGSFTGRWKAHEFHYATTISARGDTLFTAGDATGTVLKDMGLISGNVSGSFAHIIDPA